MGDDLSTAFDSQTQRSAPTPDPPDAGQPARKARGTGLTGFAARFGVVGFLGLVIVLFCILRPSTFPTSGNAIAILGSDEVVLVLALGVTLTLRMGDLDLSFGAIMGTSAILAAELSAHHHVNIWVAAVVGIIFGAVVGAFNALLIVGFGLNSFVATLGTMTIVEGIGYGASNSQVVIGFGPSLGNFVVSDFLGIPIGIWLGWAMLVIVWLVYQWTPFGRNLLFIGGNREAARLLGFPVARIRATAYIASGVLYGLAGALLVGSIGSADPSVSVQYLLPPLAAAFLGTTTIQLGRFNALGTIVGAYTLAVIQTGLQLLGASSWVGNIFDGLALIVAIGLARLARGSGSGGSGLGV
jgi:ribose transport system permease protein